MAPFAPHKHAIQYVLGNDPRRFIPSPVPYMLSHTRTDCVFPSSSENNKVQPLRWSGCNIFPSNSKLANTRHSDDEQCQQQRLPDHGNPLSDSTEVTPMYPAVATLPCVDASPSSVRVDHFYLLIAADLCQHCEFCPRPTTDIQCPGGNGE